jgi:hypothetical protein
MNSFRELQNVYEDYRGDSTNFPIKSIPIQQSQVSYRKGELPGATPGQGVRTYTVTATPFSIGEDEDEVMVPKSVIINRLNELMEDSEKKGMTYASSQLLSFLEFVSKL